MSFVLHLLLWALALVVGMLVLLIVVPLQVRAEGQVDDEVLDGRLHAWWGFGLIGVRLVVGERGQLLLFGRRVAALPGMSRERQEKPHRRRRKSKRFRRGPRWFLRHRHTLRSLMARFLRTFRLRIHLTGMLGLDDPADTAALMGLLRLVQRDSETAHIDVRPDYLGDTLELEGSLTARVWILAVLTVAVLSLFERNTWRLIRS